MTWLYRLQQRLAMTRHEALAILTLAGLFLLGLAGRHIQSRPEPLPPETYAETDRLFAEGTAALDAGTPATDSAMVPAPAVPVATPVPAGDGPQRFNLNTATEAELERLPRVGPAMARRIVEYRTRYGAFSTVRELRRVRGIGEKTLARLEPYLYVE